MKEIIINAGHEQTQVAVLEDGQLVELHLERAGSHRLVGDIFKGKVENVLPGMQAAFVDIGLSKNAFLYVDDVLPFRRNGRGTVSISDILRSGQEIIVQVVKEPMGSKGARVTTHLTLPGRFLVLMPTVDYIGISRRITDEKERERLRKIAAAVKPPGMGLIVRTAAEGTGGEELSQDVQQLVAQWQRIQQRAAGGPVPKRLYHDLELTQRVLRDVLSEDVERVVVDDSAAYRRMVDILEVLDPRFKFKVVLEEREDIFADYGIELEIKRALSRRVWLKSGGYLIIDQTEALTVIDVNTGKYTGNRSLPDTVLRTNLEAAKEIARQMRLRNLGGIIIVDFIDMNSEEHRRQVLELLAEEIKKDRTKTHILGITHLGLVEITRKKTRPSLNEILLAPCPYCEGSGRVLAGETIVVRTHRQIERFARLTSAPVVRVRAHPSIAALLQADEEWLKTLRDHTGKTLIIEEDPARHMEDVVIG